MNEYRIAFITVPNKDEALSIARALVNEKIVACVNIIPEIRSIYRWQDEVCEDPELLLVCKTTAAAVPKLKTRVKELHSYDVPECLTVKIADGLEDYLSWLGDMVDDKS